MYKYDEYDQRMVEERAAQYREQTERFLAGKLSEDEFLQLRLRNGLYIQRHAPMLRICVPYGMISSTQIRRIAQISRQYDRGYVHFTTRQNIQLNWPKLEEVPDIIDDLNEVQMHTIQTSGNDVRNTTTDQYAGAARDEISDCRPWAELVRQWSTFHPEFNWLPRKFKIAFTGAHDDRAAIQVHDVGVRLIERDGELGFQILAGGGLGRTPVLGSVIREYLETQHLLTYLDAILRIYNRYGRRDNKFKARIKILVRAMTPEVFAEKVDAEWQFLKDGPGTLTDAEIARAQAFFELPTYEDLPDDDPQQAATNRGFQNWLTHNVVPHRESGYAIANLAIKTTGVAPGDVTDKQLELIADLADRYSFGELRITHEQNVTLADVRKSDLFELWQQLIEGELASPNLGLLTDMICCPGGDFCSLANAKSLPIAEAIQRRFDDLDYQHDLGELHLNISGCMNACGHHHVGNIGILGVDKKGAEYYQVSVGGSANSQAALAEILGPSFAAEQVPDVIENIISVFVKHRVESEQFLDTYHRIGIQPFKDAVYAS